MIKKIIIVIILLVNVSDCFCQYNPVTIHTPIGSPVPNTFEFVGTDFSFSNSELRVIENDLWDNYGHAVMVENPTKKYNCHGYAWHVSNGGNKVWIGLSSSTAENIYWDDESYIEVFSQSEAYKVNYHESGNHSANTTTTTDWFRSKWGDGPLVYHKWDNVPSIYNAHLGIKYYKLCFEKSENGMFYSDYTTERCRYLLKNIYISNNANVNITVEDWFKIEGVFEAELGTTLNVMPK